ncbi:cytochrome P450 [Lichenihabitans psoromatis]|uniref:cytochrome P450 n=1 Tax=Lichenihabitans psoromatis TaxID=2528642 RepID=UPI001A93D5AC|nr:cytochrome P450 [Lichenihabitans psoromatis]
MAAYIPPYPLRPQKALPPLALLRLARRNLLAIWPEETFSKTIFGHRLFRRGVIVVNSPETVKQTFVDGAAAYEKKSPQQRNALKPLIGDGLFISDGEIWRNRRKVVAPVTHISRLPELTEGISAGAGAHLASWKALPEGAEIDALADMAHLTAGIICATIFGRKLGTKAAETIVSAFSVYQKLINQMDVLSLIGVPDFLPRFQGFRIRAAARRIHTVLDGLIDSILADKNASETSLLRSMSQTKMGDTGTAMDHRAFRDEAAVLFMAGHETTANTLAWAWFLLSQDPETERRLHAEVDAVLGEGPAQFADFAKLPFSRAIIEETLRLYPPVPLQARTAAEDQTVGGRSVKKGDLVILNAWLLHRHKSLWDQPDTFLPDRFMPGGSGIPSRYAYVPFSIGPRVCTGAAFGLTEAVLCLATLARHVRLRLKPDWVVEPVCRLSLRPGERLPMLIEHRRAAVAAVAEDVAETLP